LKRHQAEKPGENVVALPLKKRGRPKLLPEELDVKVIQMVKSMRQSGAVINFNIILAIAKGIILANDRTLLKENGGTVELGYKWCESLSNRIGFVKRKATTSKPVLAPGLILEIGHTFYHDINEIIKAHHIPPQMIINIDQTPLPFVLISKYTLEKRGAKRISVSGTADYRQITGTLGITMAGDFLPPQLIYQGKTSRCQPQYNFPKEFHVTQTNNHWANEQTSLDYLEHVLVPYVNQQRKELSSTSPWLLISDVF